MTTPIPASADHPVRNRIGGVFIHVSSMERSVSWYHRLFGMPERSGCTDKVHAIAMDGGSDFVLDQNGYDRGQDQTQRPLLMLNSADVRAAWRHVSELGIETSSGIMDFPGMSFFTFRDPDGNTLMVCGDPGSTEESAPEAGHGTEPVVYDAGGLRLRATEGAVLAEIGPEGLALAGHASSEQAYRLPLRIEADVRLDVGSLSLAFGLHGSIVFNYGSPQEMGAAGTGRDFLFTHPVHGKSFSFAGKGGLPLGQWSTIVWTIRERSVEVSVNGALFHRQEGWFGDGEGKVGLSAAMGRAVIRSVSVQPLEDEPETVRYPLAGGGELIVDPACHPRLLPDGLWLAGEGLACAKTSETVPVPFTLIVRLFSFTGSAALYVGRKPAVRLTSGGQLCLIDPSSGKEAWADGHGAWPAGEEAEIAWSAFPDRMELSVNGRLVLEHEAALGSGGVRIGIGAEDGSAVTVRSASLKTGSAPPSGRA
ncbi:VOC family protein [Paenibacillus albicereus]|uniref:VOC family protein n=1 Tax=Paenibacillus albicereus TaxID=2726185 RepID=A0A6H2GXF6_9BACL|nr:VOC family protein [Paenibacillus albicereus]QJC52085.1 VOC family protein [Paenibacillus albicereus]